MNNIFINKSVRIKNNSLFINGEEKFSGDKTDDFHSFAKSVFKHYGLKYRKFYKMDALSKLGFLAAEMLLSDINRDSDEIAVICTNKSSSLNTDYKYQESISKIPSPALFVYTLPNIVIGEICIRNKIKGESLFLVSDKYDEVFMNNYIYNIFKNTNTKICLTGIIEIDKDNNYFTNMVLISRESEGKVLDDKNLNEVINKN